MPALPNTVAVGDKIAAATINALINNADITAAGTVSLSPTTGSGTSYTGNTVVTFPPGNFTAAPNVQITMTSTATPGTVLDWWVTSVTTTSFQLNLAATTTTARSFNWFAVQT